SAQREEVPPAAHLLPLQHCREDPSHQLLYRALRRFALFHLTCRSRFAQQRQLPPVHFPVPRQRHLRHPHHSSRYHVTRQPLLQVTPQLRRPYYSLLDWCCLPRYLLCPSSPHAVQVVAVRPLQQLILLHRHFITTRAQLRRQPLHPARTRTPRLVVNFHHHLPDPLPVLLLYSLEHFFFRSLHVDLQQVDALHSFFFHHRSQAPHQALALLLFKASRQQLFRLRQQLARFTRTLLLLVRQIALDHRHFTGRVCILLHARHHRVARVVAELPPLLARAQPIAKHLHLPAPVPPRVLPQPLADLRDRLKRVDARSRTCPAHVQREQSDVRAHIKHARARRQLHPMPHITLFLEDLVVQISSLVPVHLHYGQIIRQAVLAIDYCGVLFSTAFALPAARCLHVGHQLRLAADSVCLHLHHCRRYTCMTLQLLLDLAQLDPVPTQLHLPVQPSHVL